MYPKCIFIRIKLNYHEEESKGPPPKKLYNYLGGKNEGDVEKGYQFCSCRCTDI